MFEGYTEKILAELTDCIQTGIKTDLQDVYALIEGANRIFVAGVGRTGYIMRCFAMRLAQAGYKVYWIGDVNTPSAQTGDLLILGSGSGETGSLKTYAQKAEKLRMKKLVFTTDASSSLGMMADQVILIKASAKYDTGRTKISIQPMGALFEEALFISSEAIILELMEKNNIPESAMQKRHANLE